MPRKTFHFEPDSEKVLRDLIAAYMAVTTAVVLLRAILADLPHPTPREQVILMECRANLLDSLGVQRHPH